MQKIDTRFKDQHITFNFEEAKLIERKRKGKNTIQLKTRFKSQNTDIINSFNDQNGVLKMENIKDSSAVLLYFPVEKKNSLKSIIEAYNASGLVDFIEPHILLDIQNSQDFIERKEDVFEISDSNDKELYNDKHYNLQWHFKNTGQFNGKPGEDISLEAAIKYIKDKGISFTRKQIRIAVLDDGVDPNHHDLDTNKYVESFDLMDADDEPTPYNLLTHGTNIIGVISAIENNSVGVAGINPKSKLVVGRIYGRSASSQITKRAADGIIEAVKRKARIINLSWGLKNPSSEIIDAINYATNQNVLVVAAAGNYSSSSDTAVLFPGNLDEVLTVGACDHKGRWINLNNCPAIPKFGSRYGRSVDLVAPGYNIVTTKYDHPDFPNNKSYNVFHGTSVATAIVSAVASIALMIKPNLSVSELRNLMLSNTDDIRENNPDYVGLDHLGQGRINALKIVKSLNQS